LHGTLQLANTHYKSIKYIYHIYNLPVPGLLAPLAAVCNSHIKQASYEEHSSMVTRRLMDKSNSQLAEKF